MFPVKKQAALVRSGLGQQTVQIVASHDLTLVVRPHSSTNEVLAFGAIEARGDFCHPVNVDTAKGEKGFFLNEYSGTSAAVRLRVWVSSCSDFFQ